MSVGGWGLDWSGLASWIGGLLDWLADLMMDDIVRKYHKTNGEICD